MATIRLIRLIPLPFGFWKYTTPCMMGLAEDGELWLMHYEPNRGPQWDHINAPAVLPGDESQVLEVQLGGLGNSTTGVVVVVTKFGHIFLGISSGNEDPTQAMLWEEVEGPK